MRDAHEPAGDSWFQTASGGVAYIDRPVPEAIHIEDIAHALARVCRFGGHLKVPHYSVAQHSCLVSSLCPRELQLVGLLHDAAEAYLGDVIRPLKRLLPGYRELEIRWEKAIGERFGLGGSIVDLHPKVKEADLIALATERRDLLEDGPGRRRFRLKHEPHPNGIVPLEVWPAQMTFLGLFYELGGKQD